jgi:single-stranded-DNA-specific exonuclease
MPIVVMPRDFDPRIAFKLKKDGVPSILAQVYAARGISDISEITPSISTLPSPLLLKGAKEASERLADAIMLGEKILIVSDYDADGATGCALLYRALKGFSADVDYLIPNRQEHGYGLTTEVVKLAKLKNPELLITVDNGISSFEGIELARKEGMDVIVTDHHLAADTLPCANVIVNPNQSGCLFPSKAIAGVGVAFFVMLALRDELLARGNEYWDLIDLHTLLPIVALGTIADVVALDQINRALVKEGLLRIRAGLGFAGINALASVSGMHPATITTSDIGFMLAPRINAAGRLQSMDLGVETLITNDPSVAERCAKELSSINTERKQIESEMIEEALSKLTVDIGNKYTLVLNDGNWHQGVIGIVAGRLKEKYWRPTIIFAQDSSGDYKGSARSIPGLHIRDALDLVYKNIPNTILKFGGHAMAAGLTVASDKFDLFKAEFERVVKSMLQPEDLAQIILTDGELTTSELTTDNAYFVETGVWGQHFPPPLYQNTFDVLEQSFMKDKATGVDKHSKFKLSMNGKEFTAVYFGFATKIETPQITAVYQPSINRFRGESKLQLRFVHIN